MTQPPQSLYKPPFTVGEIFENPNTNHRYVHFYAEIPPKGTKLYASSPPPSSASAGEAREALRAAHELINEYRSIAYTLVEDSRDSLGRVCSKKLTHFDYIRNALVVEQSAALSPDTGGRK